MADLSENESEEEHSQIPLKLTDKQNGNTEKDLQTIFKKLRVDNNARRHFKTKSRFSSIRRRASYPTKTETKAKKKILKEPTFVYKSCFSKKDSKLLDCNNELLDRLGQQHHKQRLYSNDSKPKTLGHKQTGQSSKSSTNISSSSCSGQFRQAQSSKIPRGDVNFDDTTPEELAAYFDQILHIPKPMSAMAEMMYT